MSNYFSGRVHSVVFANSAQDFYILRMVLDRQESDATEMFASSLATNSPISVRGHVPGMKLEIGSWFGFEAAWETHEKYGRQLVISRAPVLKGRWDTESACATLSSHGVGPRVCQQLAAHFGNRLVETLDSGDATALQQIPGITPFAAAHVLTRWKMIKAYFQTLTFLADAGVPKAKISEVWSHFGDDAKTVLSCNPWALVEIEGITFSQADEVALRLGLDFSSPLRVRGATLYACRESRGMGHMFLTSNEMLAQVQTYIPTVTGQGIAVALAALHKDEEIIIDRKTRPNTTAIYEPWMHELEVEGARLLRERYETADPLLTQPPPTKLREQVDRVEIPYAVSLSRTGAKAMAAFQEDSLDLVRIAKAALEDWSAGSHITLAPMQMIGALNALTASVSILTGLPGTGKTTTLRAVVDVLKDAQIPFLLVAPTGIAAKRMSSLTGAPAATIHRAFGAKGWDKGEERESNYTGIVGEAKGATESSDGSGEQWEYSPVKPHPARVVICDEFSMVDQHLLYRLLTCTSTRCRLVFVGDAAQLPSVGAGNVLRDLLATKLFPTVALTEIFRQETTSDIVIAAHAVHRGEVPAFGRGKESEFVLIESAEESAVLDLLLNLVERLYNQRRNFQVLSPRHAGTLGVTNLNQKLREILNPGASGAGEMRLGSEVVRESDRVMVVKNNYDLGVFNGDVGKINRLDRKANEVEVKLHGPPVVHVRFPFRDASTYLRLAYCMTVHKSQGQEYDLIVLPIVRSYGHQLQRNLFYTAITRAKKKVILIGHREAVAKAVFNSKEDVRNTLLPERLLAEFAGGSSSPDLA